MQVQLRRARDRGHADHGWLDTHHTFSFAGYHDPRFMGFGTLRVINEDRVAPGRGFGAHSHRNMEIISYVVDGKLAHRDTIGTDGVIVPGEVQVMSAGRGVAHSEMNGSDDAPVHFLQIWVMPRNAGTAPRYDQKDFGQDPGVALVVSPDGEDGSLAVDQDLWMTRVLFEGGESMMHRLRGRGVWVQVVKGELVAGVHTLRAGDGLAVQDAAELELAADGPVEALLFDVR